MLFSVWKTISHWLVLVVMGTSLLLATAWPLLQDTKLRSRLDPIYPKLCHQLPTRCYPLGGERMPACARCVGVWSGFLLAAAAALRGFEQHRLWRLTVGLGLAVVLFVSWLLGILMLPAHWHFERTVSGFLGGIGLYMAFVETAGHAYSWLQQTMFRLMGTRTKATTIETEAAVHVGK